MFGRYKDGLARNPVHIDARARFEVIEMNEAVFRYQVDNSVLFRDLHGNWKIVGRLWGEVHIDLLFGECWIWGLMVDLHDMKLGK